MASGPLHSERGGIGLVPVERGGVSAQMVVPVDPRRSLAVTDKGILANFPLPAVLGQMVAQNGGTGFTATQLFRQLWDTQNPAPGQPDLPFSPHCTDNAGTLNGFPYPCRPGEGNQAPPAVTPSINDYVAVGLYNRFDLAPTDGSDCGEYRIVFAKRAGVGPGRNFIIFEAVLPNPRQDLGLEGCRAVADFWSDLTADPSIPSRATKLRDFYFIGLPGFPPVIDMHHYGFNPLGLGQVRTNQFIQGPWLLREFKLERSCPTIGCTLRFVPVTVKTNPWGDLFNPASAHPLAPAFQSAFLSQVQSLAVNNVNLFNYTMADTFNVGQSDSQTPGTVDDYVALFGLGPSAFHTNIQAQLTAMGSPLTPRDIVVRAQALSCGGCHQRSNGQPLGAGLTWPFSVRFVHSSEFDDPADPTRFDISPALRTTFLPHRKLVLENFLTTPVLAAAFVSQSVPITVTAGSPFSVTVTMKNTGTSAWTELNAFRLGSQTPANNTTWGLSRAFLTPTETIHQGQQKSFTFTATAPAAPGLYTFQWQMVQDGVGFFGALTPGVSINVTP
ncbi:NBR1-Ig-like domain-containing protein [Archangium violaceum]|uniref:NBR1-Ig-like domain-containing protein n=1 Tax=Archangium violaceum TaxID=83451 RepID=UPI0036DC4F04